MIEGSYAVVGGVDKVIPVDLRIPDCRPRPIDLLRGLIALVETAAAPISGWPARCAYPQFQCGPIGVWVQQGPKPPPFQRPR
jgi:hypothetical protein